ncbi:unnamed protein product [Cunninghamella blakesleeana]
MWTCKEVVKSVYNVVQANKTETETENDWMEACLQRSITKNTKKKHTHTLSSNPIKRRKNSPSSSDESFIPAHSILCTFENVNIGPSPKTSYYHNDLYLASYFSSQNCTNELSLDIIMKLLTIEKIGIKKEKISREKAILKIQMLIVDVDEDLKAPLKLTELPVEKKFDEQDIGESELIVRTTNRKTPTKSRRDTSGKRSDTTISLYNQRNIKSTVGGLACLG